VATSLLTLLAVFRVWVRGFWGTPMPDMVEARVRLKRGAHLGGLRFMAAMTVVMVGVGISVAAAAGPLSDVAFTAAHDLVNGSSYIEAVLGEGAQ